METLKCICIFSFVATEKSRVSEIVLQEDEDMCIWQSIWQTGIGSHGNEFSRNIPASAWEGFDAAVVLMFKYNFKLDQLGFITARRFPISEPCH